MDLVSAAISRKTYIFVSLSYNSLSPFVPLAGGLTFNKLTAVSVVERNEA